jgi:ribose transport system substrate-binding protein
MRLKRHWRSFVFVAAATVAFGCGQSGGDSSAATTGTSSKAAGGGSDTPVEVAFVTNNTSNYWATAHQGVDAAQSELKNVTVDFKSPPNGTMAEQKQILQDMITKGVQGIAISPDDPPNAVQMLNDAASKALVITQDSDAPGSKRTCYIGSDNVAAGKQVGEEIKKAIPSGGEAVFFVGDIGVDNAKQRFEGIKEALAGSNVTIGPVKTDQADHLRAKANAKDEIVKEPNVACLVGLWSYNGPAILSAVKELGKQGKIKIVCFDGDPDTIDGVKDGIISATVVQQPYQFGHDAVVDMVKYIRGDKSVFPANGIIYIPTQVVDKSNVDAYKAKQPPAK